MSASVVPQNAALYLRSVCASKVAFRGLRCHPLTCMLLKLRLSVDSIPSALTIFKINHLRWNPFLSELSSRASV